MKSRRLTPADVTVTKCYKRHIQISFRREDTSSFGSSFRFCDNEQKYSLNSLLCNSIAWTAFLSLTTRGYKHFHHIEPSNINKSAKVFGLWLWIPQIKSATEPMFMMMCNWGQSKQYQ